jgi:multiple sugar transport system ATP-binding protein
MHNISKRYGRGVAALVIERLNLEIPDGQFVVLVGPSGCGKSTMLRMIAGLESPSDGRVTIDARDVTGLPPSARDVAMVFQSSALYPHMSVGENLSFALKSRGMAFEEIDRRVRRVAAMLGIDGLLKRRPWQLSGGERQRVALGRAIVREPKVFLFDEPLSSLDARLGIATRGELKMLHQQLRTTTVFVTHDQEEAMTLGDRLVVMRDGRVMQDASPHEVFERPANRFVASFIGTPPMNFIEGELVSASGAGDMGGVGQAGDRTGARFVARSVNGDPISWAVPAGLAHELSAHIGTRVSLGIRPAAFVEGVGAPGSIAFQGSIVLVELLGEHSDVTVQGPWGRLVARIATRDGLVAGLGVGSAIALHAEAWKVHFFVPGELGENLRHLPRAAELSKARARVSVD